MPWGMHIYLQEKLFSSSTFDSNQFANYIIFIKAGAQKLSTWQHIVNGLSYYMYLGAFKVVFLAEYLINNLEQLGASSTLMQFCSVSIAFPSLIL